jgi:enoyl-CoA hydratase/carnithine racemase
VSASLIVDGAIARLTLERPEALNALNRGVAAALEDSLGRLEGARDVSVVVLSGRGRAFCAGNDITEMPALSRRC